MLDIIKSPAKVNLLLDLLYKRKDGFHEIDTLMAKVDFCDEIIIEEADGLTVRTTTGLRQEDNFVYKALKTLEKLSGRKFDLSFYIDKKIPMGAGLAGGSSNAGVCLRYISKKYGIDMDMILKVGQSIGSDINFFIYEYTFARCTGKGEIIMPVELEIDDDIVLFIPDVHSDTTSVYKEFDIDKKQPANVSSILYLGGSGLVNTLFNVLEYPAFNIYPKLKGTYEDLKKNFPDIRMSGSGSTFYTFIKDLDSVKYTSDDMIIERTGFFKE